MHRIHEHPIYIIVDPKKLPALKFRTLPKEEEDPSPPEEE